MKHLIAIGLCLISACPSYAFSFPDQPLTHYQCPDCGLLSKDTLSTSWLIDDKDMVPAEVKPVRSQRYYRQVTGAQLKQGLELGILADGAIVRLTPAKSVQIPKSWRQYFQLKTRATVSPLSEQVQFLQNEQAFNKQFTVGAALLFELKPGLFKQHPLLQYGDNQLAHDSRWLLSVYDKRSDLYLSVALDKMQYQHGDTVDAFIEVSHDYSFPEVNWIEAHILSPTGEGSMIPLQANGTYSYHGRVPLSARKIKKGENWYVEVMSDMTVNGTHSIRVATATLSYVVPSAKIVSVFGRSKDAKQAFTATIEAVQASRYQFQAVLFATGDDGALHSVALAQTSAWLEPGRTDLDFQFEQSLPENRHAPYYIGQFELVDDMQLKPVYRYAEKIPLKKLDVE